MNLLLTQTEAEDIAALLQARAVDIRSHPDAGFVSARLADAYDQLVERICEAKVRKNGTLNVNQLTRDDVRRLETALAHDDEARFTAVVGRIANARRPKADPRRANGRRAQEEAMA